MATDYDTMATAIADEIADTALTSQIQLCIAEARRKYDRMRFYFNQKTNTFSTVANQEYYGSADLADIPNMLQIDDMKLSISGTTYALTPMAFGMMDGLQTGAIIADPISYAYFGQQIRLYPMPSATRTVTVAYFYRATAPVFGSSVTDIWTNEAYDLIRHAARKILHEEYTKEDAEAARAEKKELECKADLLAETRKRLSNGILRTDIPLRRQRFNIVAGW